MAVLQMQRISICGLKEHRKEILEILQRKGAIEINDNVPEDSVFSKVDVTSAEAVFAKSESSATHALEILSQYHVEKKSLLSSFEGRKIIEAQKYDGFKHEIEDVEDVINRLQILGKQIVEHKAEILKLQLQIETLAPWEGFDIPLDFEGTQTTSAYIGILPNTWTLEMIYEQLAEFMPVDVNVISSSREQTCIFVISEKKSADKVLGKLKANGFAYPPVSCIIVPSEQKSKWGKSIQEFEESIEEAKAEILSYADKREDIKFFSDYQSIRIEKYEVVGRLLQSEHVFILTGYITEKSFKGIKDSLSKYDVEIEAEDVSEEDNAPVVLKNNGFSSPLEGVVSAYSLPGKREMDPTMLVSLFYYAFFGLMLSDAMYGAVLMLGCGFLLMKFPNMEDGLKASIKMFMYCGVATLIWGIIFGSYFGDLVNVVADTFFGKTVSIKPLWINPVENPMVVLIFSFVLGIIHIYFGLGAKLYQCIKRKDFKGAIYDVVFWYILLSSLITMSLSMPMIMDMAGTSFTLPKEIAQVAGYVAMAAALGIILTGGRSSKNPFKRILKGAYSLYGISGYLSDILSYSRLLALGLATAVICTVVNKIGAMGGGGIKGAIVFILVFIFGNLLNIAINALGAYVHTNRLHYVEMFGKFYEGGGRKFEPFSVKTKYYKFKEKENND